MANPVPITSGTYNFLPSLGELGLNAYSRIQIYRSELTEQHMQDLRMSANLLLADWSVDIPNLWTIDLQTQVLTTGVKTYDVDPTTIAMLDVYISTDNGDGTTTDIILLPISRTEYASLPNKDQQGRPTTFWFDRLLSPTVTVWPEPDPSTVYTLKYYRCVQFQDANLTSAQNAQIPPRFFEAFASGLAAKLAEIYKPDLLAVKQALADKAWQRASQQDIENVPLFIIPGLGNYYR